MDMATCPFSITSQERTTQMKVRIGIDVGGTFTDAALISNETYELIDTMKVPTTHSDERGVAAGIIQVLTRIMEKNHVDPADVTFIAHGTTQATNALLEGDVVRVGIITIGQGVEGAKSKSDTQMGDIPLTATKNLYSSNAYVASNDPNFAQIVAEKVTELAGLGCKAIVAAEAFSVDDPRNEQAAVAVSMKQGVSATATSEISKLYGLKVRTRTAVINASILPKMLDTADMTENSIKKAGITTPLMVMRCDGGVMTVEEVRKRPILTILSGPAAGVAGALMYEKLSDGIFLEVGGTSTDISCVKDGKVMVKYAEVGGHKTYLTSLDVRTVGIGGGSMMRLDGGRLTEVGPRSVHIAGLPYEVYSDSAEIVDPVLKTIRATEDDPDYAYVECRGGKRFALSLAGAANIAGYVAEGDYARGNIEAAKKAWQPLADRMGMTVEDTARLALKLSAEKNSKVVRALLEDYGMDPRTTVLVGGGGGASAVVPHLAETLGVKGRNAKNAPVISTIGVALAMIRDMVERTIPNPQEKDILAVRLEAERRAIESGANPETVEVSVEVDTSKNIVRAIAIGTTELRSKDLMQRKLTGQELQAIVAENLDVPAADVYSSAENGSMFAMQAKRTEKKFFGLVKKTVTPLRLIDSEGVIRLQRQNGHVRACTAANWKDALLSFVDNYTIYNDGGKTLPNTFVIYGKRMIDLCGLGDEAHMIALANVDLAHADPDEPLILICSDRTD